jgi:UDP-glucose 4-epimerase
VPSYLVTGGLGFIGSHVARGLLEDPAAHVTVVDNLQGQVLPVEFLIEEITKDRPGQLEAKVQAVADHKPARSYDQIFHLASVVGPAAVLNHSGYITESIVRDTYVVVRLAKQCQARLVNVSTSEVYGGGDHGFCQEESPRVIRGPASARQEYAAGKLACEVAIANLCRDEQLDAITVRPFNVSGVRQLGVGGFVLPRFIAQALLELPLTVFGDGSQVRAFTDVRDVASGIQVAARSGRPGAFYNVGNPANRTTIRELAELVLRVTGSSSVIQFTDPKKLYGTRYEDAADKFPDAEKLLALGWQPRWEVAQTVAAVAGAFRQLPEKLMRQAAGLGPKDEEFRCTTSYSRAIA